MPAGKTLVVGVLNVTPDSFSDTRRLVRPEEAIDEGLALVAAGADWLDVGGESTRPGAAVVSEAEERARVVPVIAGLRAALDRRGDEAAAVRISVDTYKAATAEAALGAGATVVNDVSGGLLDPRILDVAAAARAAIVVGHLRGTPAQMMTEVSFGDVVSEVVAELGVRVEAARRAGCVEIWADPGIGFGKHTEHNLALLRQLPTLCAALGVPVMVGVSRKKFLGELTGRPTGERVHATAAAVTASILRGARAVRVHDVAAMRDVARIADALCAPTSQDRD